MSPRNTLSRTHGTHAALRLLLAASLLATSAGCQLEVGRGLKSDPDKPNDIIIIDPGVVSPAGGGGTRGPGPGPTDGGSGGTADLAAPDGGGLPPGDDDGGTVDEDSPAVATDDGSGPPVDPPDEDGGLPPAADGGGSGPFACQPEQTGFGGGRHNPGRNCMNCHNADIAAELRWTIAGTLYTNAAGDAPVAGATITVVDAEGKVLRLVTQRNGNFYTNEPVTFPVRVGASRCPDVQRMNATIGAGGCNRAACHGAGSRIFLP